MTNNSTITFNMVKEAAEAVGYPVNNVTGEIVTEILNKFDKIDNKDMLDAISILTAMKANEEARTKEKEMLAEAKAKAEEEAKTAWRETLLSLNERQKTVAIYIKGVLQYTLNEGIKIIGNAIIDSTVNDDNTFQIAVRLTKALDKAQIIEVPNRQQYDIEIEDFLADIGEIIRRNNDDVVIGKINKVFDTYIEMTPYYEF